MRQLTYVSPGKYEWSDVPEPTLEGAGSALVRPIVVASCDLDAAVARGRAPLAPGYAQGHEGVAEVVAVGEGVRSVRPGDRVVVPFQISCGECRECRRGLSGSCSRVAPLAMYGLGSIAGLDGGGFLADLVHVPFADAMLVAVPDELDPVAVASLSDNIPDGWRCIGPYADELAGLDAVDRRVLVVGALSIGLYASAFAVGLGASVDYVDTDPTRLASAERLGARVHESIPKEAPYPVVVHTAANLESLAGALRSTWPEGVCTDTGIYYRSSVALPMFEMYSTGVRLVTGRVNARSNLPAALAALRTAPDLRHVVESVVPWEEVPGAWRNLRGKTVVTRT